MQSVASTLRSKCIKSTRSQHARPCLEVYLSRRRISAQCLVPGQLPMPSCQSVNHDEYSSASSRPFEQTAATSQCPPSTSGQQPVSYVNHSTVGSPQLLQQTAVKAGTAMLTIAISTILFPHSALAGDIAGASSNPITGDNAGYYGIALIWALLCGGKTLIIT